jgi:hypothetical protein
LVTGVEVQVNNNPPTIYYHPPSPFVLSTGGGSNTVNVLNTRAGIPVRIIGGGSDTVNVGSGGSVQGIVGALYVENPPWYTTLNIDDSSDQAARTVTLSTFTPPGDSPWGSITGLSPAAISYEYADTSSVHLITGPGANTIDVLATGFGVPTYLSSSGGTETVNVGDPVYFYTGGIQGDLYIDSLPSATTLNIYYPRGDTYTPATFTPGFDSESPWGSITGLSPASINYEYADISHLNLFPGQFIQ